MRPKKAAPEQPALYGLTEPQRQLLQIIQELIDETGVSPTLLELRTEMDEASKSSIHRKLVCLRRRGWIETLPYAARSIRVLHRTDLPDFGQDLEVTDAGNAFVASLKSGLADVRPPQGAGYLDRNC